MCNSFSMRFSGFSGFWFPLFSGGGLMMYSVTIPAQGPTVRASRLLAGGADIHLHAPEADAGALGLPKLAVPPLAGLAGPPPGSFLFWRHLQQMLTWCTLLSGCLENMLTGAGMC